MKFWHIIFVLLVLAVVLADPPPKKKPEKLKPNAPKGKGPGPKPFKPKKDASEQKKERLMEKMNKKQKPGKLKKPKIPKMPPGLDKGKGKGGLFGKGKDKNGKPFRPPMPPKGKGKGDKGKGRDKGNPRGWRKPPKLPMERFGPCQACYATVSWLDNDLSNWDLEAKEALDFDTYCPGAVDNYSLVSSPKGKGMPIIQGPGLPDLTDKLKEGEEFGEVPADIRERFEKDFTKICRKTFLELDQKIFQVFTPPKGAAEDEKVMSKWRATNKRAICDKYCRKPKPPPMRKTEL